MRCNSEVLPVPRSPVITMAPLARVAEGHRARRRPVAPARQLPDRSVIAVDDLETWERSESGHAVLEILLELVERHSDRTLFVFTMCRQADSFVGLAKRGLLV
jgi:hypothetical protein